MSMNGIDVSNWQAGINLAAVPADFVVMKATEGISYVSPDCDRQYQQAKAAGRCLGVYHYANGGNVQAEADWFLNNMTGRPQATLRSVKMILAGVSLGWTMCIARQKYVRCCTVHRVS